MILSNWIQSFRHSIAQKRIDRAGGAVVVSQVSNTGSITSTRVLPTEALERYPSLRGTSTQLLDDSYIDDDGCGPIKYLADVPSEIRDRIEIESLLRLVRKLETPLRALHTATSRKGVPPDEMRRFLLMWRQALGDYLELEPDERSVLTYDRSADEAYFVRGYCVPGARLAILEPCWRLHGRVAIRGEARVIEESE
ncbi:MAG TPA: hypothetical protein VFJ58_16285 [Armatimonadota bacterium]|nr:hypothetical protein [Armatimonadota bacterium]